MKKIIILQIILLLFFNFSAALSQPPLSPNMTNSEGEREGQWTILFDENFKPLDDPSRAAYYRLINYRSGKPVGEVRDYYVTGEIQWVGALLSDSPDVTGDGLSTYYYKNGKKRAEGKFKNGKMNGFWKEWDEDGSRSEGEYFDGKEEGSWTFWHNNGSKSREGRFQNGKRNGFWKEWYEYGGRGEGRYRDGKEDGAWILWGKNGNKRGEGGFKGGLMHGSWVFWGDLGGKSAGKFVNDKKEGRWVFWDKNGNKVDEIEFKNGKASK